MQNFYIWLQCTTTKQQDFWDMSTILANIMALGLTAALLDSWTPNITGKDFFFICQRVKGLSLLTFLWSVWGSSTMWECTELPHLQCVITLPSTHRGRWWSRGQWYINRHDLPSSTSCLLSIRTLNHFVTVLPTNTYLTYLWLCTFMCLWYRLQSISVIWIKASAKCQMVMENGIKILYSVYRKPYKKLIIKCYQKCYWWLKMVCALLARTHSDSLFITSGSRYSLY